MTGTLTTACRTVPFRDSEIGLFEVGDPEAPALGYLHGMLGNAGPPPFLAALAAATGRRVLAPCLPGFSPSPPQVQLRGFYDWVVAASEVVNVAGLEGAPMVASSVGAMLALEVAAVRPGAFPSLVVISPLGLWDDDAPVADLFAVRQKDQPALLVADPEVVEPYFTTAADATDEAALVADMDRYFSRRVSASLVWPIPDRGIATRLHLVGCPVGLIWGAEDRVVPASYAKQWSAALPAAVGTEVITGAGHCAEWDQPDQVARTVATLLQSEQDRERGDA